MKSRVGRAQTALFPGIVIAIVFPTIFAGAAPAHAGLLRDIRHALFPSHRSLEYKTLTSDTSVDEAAVSQPSADGQLTTRPTEANKPRVAKAHRHMHRVAAHPMRRPKRAGAAANLRPLHHHTVRMARLEHRLSPRPLAVRSIVPAKPHRSTAPLRPRIVSAAPTTPKPHAEPAPVLRVPASPPAKPATIISAKAPPRVPLAATAPVKPRLIAISPTQRIVAAAATDEPSIPLTPPFPARAEPQMAISTERPPASNSPAAGPLRDGSVTEGIDKLSTPPLPVEPEPTVLDDALAELRVVAGIVLLLGAATAVIGMWWLRFGARAWDARQRQTRPHQSMIDIFPAEDGESGAMLQRTDLGHYN